MVLAYALKAPEGHYVSVDYVLAVCLASATPRHRSAISISRHGTPRRGGKNGRQMIEQLFERTINKAPVVNFRITAVVNEVERPRASLNA